ncbi:hypothetical protein DDA98_06235 [Clostridium perfringens]|uniref:phage tail spike protein n=1 Tax=Clostridium perfringens TaxID=1502 RepID=UPI000D508562|nr:phage tail spike protein [Clostridium perfringens]PVE16851.1 hypothetical protein DDA98_06235 [Clostridium perfringens]
MLKLKDKNKKIITGLTNYKDLCIESVLATGDKKLSFSLPKEDKFYNLIEEEGYIETKEAEFVIKARDVSIYYTRFDCVLNLEELEANIFDRFESVEQTITNALNLAIVGTGWTVKSNTLKKKRTVRCTNKNALEIVQEIKKTYRVDIVFNTLEKKIEVYEKLGEDKGAYFIDSLNLTALQVQSDSYKFATRIIAEGKDNLTFEDINGGKNYVENFQYSKKIKTIYWKDERYTVKESLLEDARAKLEEISKPFTSYNASVLNLAELNPKYKSILDYSLGDTITLLSKSNKVRDKQRIVKIVEYPQDHSRDTVELANATLKFEDIQQENQETTDTVNNITTDNGTVDGSTIDSITTKQIEDFEANVIKVAKLKAILAEIENLHVNKADIQNLNAVIARIGTLEATKASITELNAIHAIIQQIKAGKADIADLNAAVAKVGILENKTAVLENTLAGNLTAENFKANSIVAGSGIIANGAIGDAEISSLSGNKLRFGTIDTGLVTVSGPNGRLKILGNKLQIFDDVNNKLFERIMLGINDKNRACLTLRATDGQTVLLTEEGLTKAGITDGFGKADDNSLSALKLDKNSIVRQVNGATETIAGTRIQVGDRTLDIELSTQKNTITEHSKELSSQKASLTALDNALKFKVDSQTFTQSTETINSNINRSKQDAINEANRVAELKKQEAINSANSHADSKANEALNNAKAFVNAEITTVNSHLNKAAAEINVLKKQIELKVGQSDIDKSIQNIEFGGRNLFLKSKGPFKSSNEYVGISITSVVEKYLNRKITISADVKANKVGKIRFYSLGGYSVGFWVERDVTTEWTRIKATGKFTLNDEKQKWCDLSFYGNYGSGLFTEVRNVKIELGELASDYTEAPEDTDKLIIDNIKTVTDKISTVESKFTQENNSIKASIQDLNSTTQSITTNVSNINRDLTSKINSNLDAAKSFATDIAIAKANLAKEQAIANADGKITEEERKRIAEAKKNLDTAIARADKAKQDAINTASSDATNKANNALNSAKAYTNAEITTINSKVHNVESNLNILSDRINSKVSQSDVDKSISNIIIGGRNLFLDSDLQVCTKSKNWFDNFKSLVTTENNLNYATMRGTQWFFGQYVELEEGQTYTASCLARVNKASQLKSFLLHIKLDAIANVDYVINKACTDNFQRISYTFVWSRANARERIHFLLRDSSAIVDIALIKLEKGNKATDWSPAPEDVNTLVTDSIKIVDSKISDVSSNVTQLRDSVTTQINSINSKTHSIETNLGGKASKQEVTEVNNRVATIKASLDGITQRVSATESKTQTLESNLNGKASKQEVNNVSSKVVSLEANLNGITNRVSSTETVTKSLNDKLWEATNKLNNVEQRITPTSIINTVSSAYYKKGEVDNVFSTKSQVEQLDNRINYRFSNTGYSNLIFNGNFANGTVHWRNWGNCSLVAENGQLTVRAKQSSNNANIGAVSSTFVLEKGKKYSLTFQGCSSWNIPWLNYIYLLGEDGVNYRLDLRIDINSADLVYRTATFTAPATKWVRLLIGVEGYLQTDISGFKLVDVCLVEGDIPRRFVPNANEISEGATSIDSNGVIVRHTNGSYTSMTLGGFAWKTKNMEKAYHCLAETGWVNISTGAWLGDHYDIKITLPEYFRGKVFTPCSMIQGWYVESNFSLNQLVVNIPYETINYSEGSFVIRVKALTRDGVFQRNINISWLAIA